VRAPRRTAPRRRGRRSARRSCALLLSCQRGPGSERQVAVLTKRTSGRAVRTPLLSGLAAAADGAAARARRHRVRWTPVNLGRLQEWVDAGRLDAAKVLTMKDFRDNGLVHKRIPHGVKLLAKARAPECARLESGPVRVRVG
jgi:hypothetical protein